MKDYMIKGVGPARFPRDKRALEGSNHQFHCFCKVTINSITDKCDSISPT